MLCKSSVVRKLFRYRIRLLSAILIIVVIFGYYVPRISRNTTPLRDSFPNSDFSNVSDINVTLFENIAVIVELRPAPILIPIVLNVLQNIPDSWRIQIFHRKLNAYFINSSRLSTYIESGKIILTEIDDYNGRFDTFKNTLMTNISFWKQI
jgi:hypothetical protein